MTPQRILGIALLVIAAILLVIAMNSSHSIADQLSSTFTGHFTDKTTWYLVGGAVLGVVGASVLVMSARGRRV